MSATSTKLGPCRQGRLVHHTAFAWYTLLTSGSVEPTSTQEAEEFVTLTSDGMGGGVEDLLVRC